MRTSETPRSSSACDTLRANSFRFDDAGHRDDLVPAHDEGPRLALGTGDLCVDEHVLDLLRSPGEPIAGAPGSYLKAWEVRGDLPLAPPHLALERDGCALPPDDQQGPDDTVLASRLDPLRGAARDQPVEHGLHLVARGVTRRAEPVGRERVADSSQLVLAASAPAIDDLRTELFGTETRVLVSFGPPQSVVDMQRRDPVAELTKGMPEAGRVSAT